MSPSATVNGDHAAYVDARATGLLKNQAQSPTAKDLSKEHENVLKGFRVLVADLCEQFGGGHPG
jgi:dihydroxyacetone synthase